MIKMLGAIVVAVCLSAQVRAADFLSPFGLDNQQTALSQVDSIPQSRLNSIYYFAGALSTTDIYSTGLFNLNKYDTGKNYDNFIVGIAYSRDIWSLGYGVTVGGEIGIADRFGRYAVCCDEEVVSSGIVNSLEVWFGPQIRHEGFIFFDGWRISPALTFGFSATTNSIGREREREITLNGNARLLLYLGPELSISMVNLPNWEFVLRLHHRSGADGMFGKIMEGYNANIVGIRYRY
jgi:hypothetical protein